MKDKINFIFSNGACTHMVRPYRPSCLTLKTHIRITVENFQFMNLSNSDSEARGAGGVNYPTTLHDSTFMAGMVQKQYKKHLNLLNHNKR